MPAVLPATPAELARAAWENHSAVIPAEDGEGRIRAFCLAKAVELSGNTAAMDEEAFSDDILEVAANDEIDIGALTAPVAGDRLILVGDGNRHLGWTTANACLVNIVSTYPAGIVDAISRDQHIFLKDSDTIYAAHKELFEKQRQVALILDGDESIIGVMTDKDISLCIERGCDIWNSTTGMAARPVSLVEESELPGQLPTINGPLLGGNTIVTTDGKGRILGTISEDKLSTPMRRRHGDSEEAADSKAAAPSETLILDTVLNNSLRTGIVGTDEYLNIIYFNEAITDFIENPDRLRLGGEIWQVTESCGISRKSFASYLEGARKDREQVIVNWVDIKDTRRYIQCRLSKVDNLEHIAGFVLSVQDITAQRNAEDAIRKLAYQDKLTQLPNRLLFEERLEAETRQAKRDKTKFAIMMLDLDGFKKVNDDHGHTAGDELLCTVSKRLKEALRETDTVARFGGDEFIFILPDIANETDVSLIADKMRDVTMQRVAIGDRDIKVGASIGFSIYPDDSSDAQELLDQADARMYKDKRKEI